MVVNLKLNKELTKQQQNLKEKFGEEGANTFYTNLFRDTFICTIGYMCYQMCIPLEIRAISEEKPDGYTFLISVEMLNQIYDPQLIINNSKSK